MIEILNGKEKYIVDENFDIGGSEEKYKAFLKSTIECILLDYDLTKGFTTSFVANKLEKLNFDILRVEDKELIQAKEGTIY